MRLKLSLSQRIGLIFLLLSLFVVLTAALGLRFTDNLRQTVDTVVASVDQVQGSSMLTGSWAGIARALDEAIDSHDSRDVAALRRELLEFQAQLAKLSDDSHFVEGELATQHLEELADLQRAGAALVQATDRLGEAMEAERWVTAIALRANVLVPNQIAFSDALNRFRRGVQLEVNEAVSASQRAETQIRTFWLVAALVLLTNAAVIGYAIARSTVVPIRSLTEQTSRVMSRDFSPSTPLSRQDEIGELSRAFKQMTDWLNDSYQNLQERVNEQTRHLALAAEIGQAISQVRDLDTLLIDAVELIRLRFHLYYAQVFLTDESELSLVLHAGTGLTGDEMVRLGHRLTIGPGSITGQAAFSREAVVVPDTAHSEIFRPNPLLPHTHAELAVPLLVGNRVAGVLNLQSSDVNGLTAESLPAFNAIAGQLAIAIQNARLFTEVESARREMAAQAQQLTREGWEAYLDAIDRNRRVGFVFDGQKTSPAAPDGIGPAAPAAISMPIEVSGEALGTLVVEPGANGPLPPETDALVKSVAEQVARRIENIRLLTQANSYRSEAERATRRLTQQAWQAVHDESDLPGGGYQYDHNAVEALEAGATPEPDSIAVPLRVRDAPIGLLEVTNVAGASEDLARDLLTSVAEQLGNHIENLRLAEETEKALAESQRRNQELTLINKVVASASSSLDLQQNLKTIVSELVEALRLGHAGIALLDESGSALTVVADASADPTGNSVVGAVLPVTGNSVSEEVIRTGKSLTVKDAQHNPRMAPAHDLMRQRGTKTLILNPVIVAGEVIGTLGLDILEAERELTYDEERLVDTIMLQVATAIQQSRLFHQLQITLARTEALYAGSSRIIQARSIQEVLTSVVDATALKEFEHVSVFFFDRPWQSEKPATMSLLAGWNRPGESVQFPRAGIGNRLNGLPSLRQLEEGQPILLADGTDLSEWPDLALLMHAPEKHPGLAIFPVAVRGQWLGILTAEGPVTLTAGDADTRQIANLIGQAASVIESLRLLEKTEAALAETATLFHISVALNSATSVEEMLAMAASPSIIADVDLVELLVAEASDGELPQTLSSVAAWSAEAQRSYPAFPGRTRVTTSSLPDFESLTRDRYAITMIDNVVDDPRLDASHRRRFVNANIAATVLLPLRQGRRWLGLLVVNWSSRQTFGPREQRLFTGFATQAAVTLANLQLLSQSRAQARRERILREVTERVRNASDVDTVLRIAAQEIGNAIGRKTVMVLGNGHATETVPVPSASEEGHHV